MKSLLKPVLTCGALLGLVAPVSAHHSTTMFAHDKVVSISGVIKEGALDQPARGHLRGRRQSR